MADSKISALTEATTAAAADEMAMVQGGTTKRIGVDTLFSSSNAVWGGWVYPYTTGWVGTAGLPLTSTSWDGDSFSTTAKTIIDLSVVFGAPAGIKAILAVVFCRDSGSAAGNTLVILSPNSTASSGIYFACAGLTNDAWARGGQPVPCDANGDVYYQTVASGASTLDVYFEIWAYQL